MDIYVLVCEAYSDDHRLLGVYSSVDEARAAYDGWEGHGYYPFIRVERRILDAGAYESRSEDTVFETGLGEE